MIHHEVIEGRWVMAIPEPYRLLVRLRCSCDRKFWTRDGYRRHYATSHLLGVDAESSG